MRLQFIYKNNSKIYNVVEGANISMSYNEDLSHGTIILREKEKIDIEAFDEIKLLDLDFSSELYMLVDEFIEKETRNRTGDKVYSYEIKIMSQTKLLENKILPSLAITPKTNGGMTIKAYLERYNDLYGQKLRTESGFVNKFVFDVGTKFDNTCPELQFNNPTFRECLTQLMMVNNCIPIVQNNVISYIDLSEKHDLLDKNDEHIYSVETSQSSGDYVSELRMNMKNTISPYIIKNERLNGRSNDSASVNTGTIEFYAQKPIYELKRAVLHVICNFTDIEYGTPRPIFPHVREGDSTEIIDCDITELVVEKSKWDTLNVASNTSSMSIDEYKNYRNTTLYYTRGDNAIKNVASNTTYYWWYKIDVLKLLGKYAIEKFVREYLGSYSVTGNWSMPDDIGDNYKFFEFISITLEYKTKDNSDVKAGKNDIQSTEREVVDNQSENYVNSYTQGLLEYAKANRLGNKLFVYSGRFPRNYDKLPTIGSYYDNNEIIYKVDYEIYNNFVNANIFTCPNYVLRNYFTSVQSKLRSWKIVDGKEALERNDIKKIYFEFSKEKHIESSFSNIYTLGTDYDKLFLQSLIGDRISTSTTQLASICNIYYGNVGSNIYSLRSMTNIFGNSVAVSFGFDDNYIVGRYISQRNVENGNLQNLYKYADDNGQVDTISFGINGGSERDYDISFYVRGNNYSVDDGKAKMKSDTNESNMYPKVSLTAPSGYIVASNMPYYKDNKEILKMTFQIEICSNTNDIAIGKKFIDAEYYLEGIYEDNVKIIVFNGNVIDYANPDVLPSGGTEMNITNLKSSVENNTCFKLFVDGATDNQSCFIYDKNRNEVILSFYGNTIYANLLLSRNKNIYKRDGNNLVVIGSI